MAKLVIPRKQLSDINKDTEQYQIRYRLITDDKNVSSYWSPVYSIDPEMYFIPGTIYSPGRLTLSKIGASNAISASWDSVSIRKSVNDQEIQNSYVTLDITTASFNAGLITYNVVNDLSVGQTVSVYGSGDFRFNFEEGKIFSRTSSSFTFQPATTTLTNGTSTSGGKVIGKSSLIGEVEDYDLWLRWSENGPSNYSPWIYKERIFSTSVVINIPTSYIDVSGTARTSPKNVDIEIYRPASPIERENPSAFLMYSGTLGF